MILSPEKDPLGQAMKDYQAHGSAPDILVKSDLGEDDVYDIAYYFRSEAELPPWEQTALEHCKGRVLDIGAGSGCHALILQERNMNVLAVDVSPGAVEVMRKRGVEHVRLMDVYSVSGEKFDTLLMLMNGLGIVGDFEGLDDFLEFARTLLNPGGQILVDSSNISYLLESDSYLIDSIEHGGKLGEVQFQMIYRDISSDVFPWLYADYPTLRNYAQRHGYTCHLLAEGRHYEYVARIS